MTDPDGITVDAWTAVRPGQGRAVRLFGLVWSDERQRFLPHATEPLRAINVSLRTARTRMNTIVLGQPLEAYLAAKPLPQDYLRKLRCYLEVSIDEAERDIAHRQFLRKKMIDDIQRQK